MKYLSFILLFAFFSVFLFLAFLFAFLFHIPAQEPQTVEVRVERGESLSSVAHKLRTKGVISNEGLFSAWARLRGLDKKIHWGLYRFELPLAPREVINRMVLGRGIFYKVTIPEGLTVREIAALLEKAGVANKKKLLREANNPELLSQFGLEEKGLEGYLFPTTYYFTPFATERDVLTIMAGQFRKSALPMVEIESKKVGLDRHEVVTLASVIEKETAIEAEKPLVSAVFHNRLKLDMPLQSDPTVIYGLKRFNGNLTRKDLQTPTPYNTYRIRGLPPTPISNPGLSSLQAALRPAPVPYLYFVSKNDGSHLFSVSLREHNRAVRLYQKSGKQDHNAR